MIVSSHKAIKCPTLLIRARLSNLGFSAELRLQTEATWPRQRYVQAIDQPKRQTSLSQISTPMVPGFDGKPYDICKLTMTGSSTWEGTHVDHAVAFLVFTGLAQTRYPLLRSAGFPVGAKKQSEEGLGGP
jgi:hypothetical protein